MPPRTGNQGLHEAHRARRDEFYTQLEDIEAELRHYKKHFEGKTVFCNCDDPYESNFFKFFASDFNQLGLKKLIATCYNGSPVAWKELDFGGETSSIHKNKTAHKIVITEIPDLNNDGAVNMSDVDLLIKSDKNVLTELHGDDTYGAGDFRSRECIELLKEADIVVTNPPFSLFREYVAQLFEYKKQFLIIGNKNAITYKEIFPLIQANKLWVGATPMTKDLRFIIPQSYIDDALANNRTSAIATKNGKIFGRSPSIWFTNLDHKKRHEELDLYKKYTPELYPKYDNYDAINVNKTAEIPMDYDGIMGVPITFLDKYNPEQFEIVKFRKGDDDSDLSINGECPYFRILIRKIG